MVSDKLLKLASYLYFSYAGFILIYGLYTYYKKGLFYSALMTVDIIVFVLILVIIVFGAVIYNEAKHHEQSVYSMLVCILGTISWGLLVSYTTLFWFALLPCLLVITAYMAKNVITNNIAD